MHIRSLSKYILRKYNDRMILTSSDLYLIYNSIFRDFNINGDLSSTYTILNSTNLQWNLIFLSPESGSNGS